MYKLLASLLVRQLLIVEHTAHWYMYVCVFDKMQLKCLSKHLKKKIHLTSFNSLTFFPISEVCNDEKCGFTEYQSVLPPLVEDKLRSHVPRRCIAHTHVSTRVICPPCMRRGITNELLTSFKWRCLFPCVYVTRGISHTGVKQKTCSTEEHTTGYH